MSMPRPASNFLMRARTCIVPGGEFFESRASARLLVVYMAGAEHGHLSLKSQAVVSTLYILFQRTNRDRQNMQKKQNIIFSPVTERHNLPVPMFRTDLKDILVSWSGSA